jgi:hypothetical protein
LFTLEFYQSAHRRLRKGGLLAQWLALYELAEDDFALALRTMGQEFAHLEVWSNGSVALVIASDEPIVAPERMAVLPDFVAGDLMTVGLPVAGMKEYLAKPDLDPDQVRRLQESVSGLNRDDLPVLEFRCARNLYRQIRYPDSARWRSQLGIR